MAQSFETQISVLGAYPFLTRESDVENYFLNADHLSHVNSDLTSERAQALIDQATFETRDKSIKVLINIRTEAAIRGRKGGSAHDAGDLASQAIKDYDSDPQKWRRGKLVFKTLKALLHQELGKSPVILSQSPHLKIPELQAIRDAIWPSKTATA